MLPHQARMVDELKELQGRIEKLQAFIEGLEPDFDLDERVLLLRQMAAMRDYAYHLSERIDLFAWDL